MDHVDPFPLLVSTVGRNIGRAPKRNVIFQPSIFLGARLVSGRISVSTIGEIPRNVLPIYAAKMSVHGPKLQDLQDRSG